MKNTMSYTNKTTEELLDLYDNKINYMINTTIELDVCKDELEEIEIINRLVKNDSAIGLLRLELSKKDMNFDEEKKYSDLTLNHFIWCYIRNM